MPLFAFKSNNHFVGSSDGSILQVYQLTKPTNHLSSIKKADWKEVATITFGLEKEEEDDDAKVLSYDGLLFFDGYGRIEGEEALAILAKHLKELHLLVSPEGYCFQQVLDLGGVYSDFGIHYLRLNDMFSWPHHGVDLVTTNVWSRSELTYRYLPRHEDTSKQPAKGGGGMSKEKYRELERSVKEKDEELEKLKEEIDEANEKLKTADDEHRKQLKKKDRELRMLSKKNEGEEAKTKRIDELEKLNEELEEANNAKDEELQKFRKKKASEEAKTRRIEELEKLKEELLNLKKVKDEEIRKRTEELEKVKEEMEIRLDEELRKLRREKTEELDILERKKEAEKNDETAKTREVEAELEVAREKLSYSVAEVAKVKKELEECQRKSWAILPSTEFLPQSLEAKDKYLATRQRVPPETFECRTYTLTFVINSHKLIDKMLVDGDYGVRFVDEESNPTEWPPLPVIRVYIGRGDVDFDKNNWWYLKTTHPEGGLTMLVYYEGNRSQISHNDSNDPIIPLPFSPGIHEVYSYTHTFSLFRLQPFGVRYGFAYRPR